MTLLAYDWNATRVRAVLGAAGEYPLPIALDPPSIEMPMTIALDQYAAEVGSAGLRQCRTAPYHVCQSFLPHVTDDPNQGPRWKAGRHSLDARTACDLVWRKLHATSASAQGIILTVPSYLQPAQIATLRKLGEQSRHTILGSAPTLLAAAAAGFSEQAWQRSVLVIDADDHALTLGWVKAQGDKAHLVECRVLPQLGVRIWKDRLLNVLSDLCVRQHRRDPRDVPTAEQSVYDQIDPLCDSALKNQAVQLGVQGQQWFKHLLIHPEQPAQYCQALARQALREAEHLLLCWPASELPRSILLTHQAGRLPGLLAGLHALVACDSSTETRLPTAKLTEMHEEDFGEELMFPESEERGCVMVLPAEAPARAAHGLSEWFKKGSVPGGHLETGMPLLLPPPVDAGPPRLHCQGRDYLLREAHFAIGSQFGCQLHFDRTEHPEVASRHCEVVFDRRAYTLHNRCREGTLVNDHPVAGSVALRSGDRIRLGPRGPLLRFLGKALPRAVPTVFV